VPFGDQVQLLRLIVVAEPVDAMVPAKELPGRRLEGEADGIA
jgi:hypothetical protein